MTFAGTSLPVSDTHIFFIILLQILRDSAPTESSIFVHSQQGQEDHLFHLVSGPALSCSNTSGPGKRENEETLQNFYVDVINNL